MAVPVRGSREEEVKGVIGESETVKGTSRTYLITSRVKHCRAVGASVGAGEGS